MPNINSETPGADFLKSLGFPSLDVHETFSHFDFVTPSRRVLLIGPMGSGKTEYAARVWRDAMVAKKKGDKIKDLTSTGERDRRNVFFIRTRLDEERFTDYPEDALSYRSGYIRCGKNIAKVKDSFEAEEIIRENKDVGTFIIDEASFFDERLVYVTRNYAVNEGCMFVFPTLMLNFRREFFNSTARLLLDTATDIIPLVSYCDDDECLNSAFYTYRYYSIEGKECPALYFDPLIVVGGDKVKEGGVEPNYASRCDKHHYLPGKEYTFYVLKPLAQEAERGNTKPLIKELRALKEKPFHSLLRDSIEKSTTDENSEIFMDSLLPSFLAEKALAFVFAEQNLISEVLLKMITKELSLNSQYLEKILKDNNRPVSFADQYLF